jgi:hypothetical protein
MADGLRTNIGHTGGHGDTNVVTWPSRKHLWPPPTGAIESARALPHRKDPREKPSITRFPTFP